jgi:hypothetical protein
MKQEMLTKGMAFLPFQPLTVCGQVVKTKNNNIKYSIWGMGACPYAFWSPSYFK